VTKYTHSVIGTASALIRNPDGTVRDATPQELAELRKRYEPALRESFTELDEANEPGDPDGECFRGGEAAAYLAEEQARIQRELKR
jgi:hypothetical protein